MNYRPVGATPPSTDTMLAIANSFPYRCGRSWRRLQGIAAMTPLESAASVCPRPPTADSTWATNTSPPCCLPWRSSAKRDRITLPSRPMNSSVPAQGNVGAQGQHHLVAAPLKARELRGRAPYGERRGLKHPVGESAFTAVPTVTGSKNASCRVPSGAVTVTSRTLTGSSIWPQGISLGN